MKNSFIKLEHSFNKYYISILEITIEIEYFKKNIN